MKSPAAGMTQSRKKSAWTGSPMSRASNHSFPIFYFSVTNVACANCVRSSVKRHRQKGGGFLKFFGVKNSLAEKTTPLEQDIALDPELLGRAFENLLAAVNP